MALCILSAHMLRIKEESLYSPRSTLNSVRRLERFVKYYIKVVLYMYGKNDSFLGSYLATLQCISCRGCFQEIFLFRVPFRN